MGSLSVSTYRGLVHWQGLLLLVSLLTFWSPPTTAEISIVSTYAPKGKDVLLRVYNMPPEVVGVTWYKGENMGQNKTEEFSMMASNFHLRDPENNGQHIVTDDGSLLLKNVTMDDTGTYAVVVHLPGSEIEMAFGQLNVYEPLSRPVLLASSYAVRENEDSVVLTCYTDSLSIQWLFNDMNLKFKKRKNLAENGRRLIIDPVKRRDAGTYKCVALVQASNFIMRVESQHIELHVLY